MLELPPAYWQHLEAHDNEAALGVLEKLAEETSNPDVMFLLGQELGVMAAPNLQNYTKAAQWFSRAAACGHAKALYEYGLASVLGLGVEKSEAQGLENIKRAADLGNPLALRFVLYSENQLQYGFALQPAEAERYFELTRKVDMSDF